MIHFSSGLAGASVRKTPDEPKHTPGPWQRIDTLIVNAKGLYIAKAYEIPTGGQLANAEFIVRAVNCHDELVASLTALVELARLRGGKLHEYGAAVAAAEIAIAKATGTTDPHSYIACRTCGDEVPERYSNKGRCLQCAPGPEVPQQ